ncbi:hypothetical protein CONLIGDRAFT_684990 [Coniochaeta ligniaria NRRL 30616]|uniref:Uncharacterized protein n=1 Tax=Coniochaeta ligniaria NRRL 30616 TaxID=1408157 RepID=A0A1J7ICD8_9PEZI|nr:hypothetical protein CONLIGDRAFT_684990 [Coniochaeta ligniaria NRRL 30616]
MLILATKKRQAAEDHDEVEDEVDEIEYSIDETTRSPRWTRSTTTSPADLDGVLPEDVKQHFASLQIGLKSLTTRLEGLREDLRSLRHKGCRQLPAAEGEDGAASTRDSPEDDPAADPTYTEADRAVTEGGPPPRKRCKTTASVNIPLDDTDVSESDGEHVSSDVVSDKDQDPMDLIPYFHVWVDETDTKLFTYINTIRQTSVTCPLDFATNPASALGRCHLDPSLEVHRRAAGQPRGPRSELNSIRHLYQATRKVAENQEKLMAGIVRNPVAVAKSFDPKKLASLSVDDQEQNDGTATADAIERA